MTLWQNQLHFAEQIVHDTWNLGGVIYTNDKDLACFLIPFNEALRQIRLPNPCDLSHDLSNGISDYVWHRIGRCAKEHRGSGLHASLSHGFLCRTRLCPRRPVPVLIRHARRFSRLKTTTPTPILTRNPWPVKTWPSTTDPDDIAVRVPRSHLDHDPGLAQYCRE